VGPTQPRGAHPASNSVDVNGQGVTMANRLPLVPKLRMTGSIPLIPTPIALMAWTGTILCYIGQKSVKPVIIMVLHKGIQLKSPLCIKCV
jgi:hypothetical protein